MQKTEITNSDKLTALLKLQQLDSKIDQISKLKGDLPQEVRDIEDEGTGLKTRLKKFEEEIKFIQGEISGKKLLIKNSGELIKKYKQQQNNVKNNREFEALGKEVELQTLEIQAAERKIKDYSTQVELKENDIKETQGKLDDLENNLKLKKSELDVISAEFDEEEDKLLQSAEKASKIVEERLLTAYKKIRKNARNGLAIVTVKRNACGGCFAQVPPQRQVEIRAKKSIIICENCGRILADVEVPEVVVV